MAAKTTIDGTASSGWLRLRLLPEAGLAVTLASLAIAFLPFRRLASRLSRARQASPTVSARAAATVAEAVRAVEAVSRRLPWRTVCFQKGLALHWMLRRRGLASILHLGVAQEATKGLSAHVWVSLENEILMGGETTADYACLTRYPDPEAKRGPA